MSYKEKLELLSNDGMLIERPLFVFNDKVLIRLKEVNGWRYRRFCYANYFIKRCKKAG